MGKGVREVAEVRDGTIEDRRRCCCNLKVLLLETYERIDQSIALEAPIYAEAHGKGRDAWVASEALSGRITLTQPQSCRLVP